ncbi:MAG: Ig-like domain-containing protein [Myxococcota bacterium]
MNDASMFVRSVLLLCLLNACGDDSAPLLDASPEDGVDGSFDSADAPIDAPIDAAPDMVPVDMAIDEGVVFDTPVFASLCDPDAKMEAYPAPDAWTPNLGPGLPRETLDEALLGTNCAFLDGGDEDETDHHNLVTMYQGYLMMPWAPEFGSGGISFFDVSNPCEPVSVGSGFSPLTRETHTLGFSHLGGAYAVTASLRGILQLGAGGVMFWDVSDPTAPTVAGELDVPDFFYPDAYGGIIMSAFWQVPFVYLGAGFNGVYIADATDATDPRLVGQYQFEPRMRVGQVQAVGNLLVVTSTSGARTVLLDISDPIDPKPIPGGDFLALDGEGAPREFYFANFSGGYVYYARKDEGGGVSVMDVRDPTAPVYAGDLRVDGSGGYVFLHEGRAFVGMGRRAAVFDVSNLDAITELSEYNLEGDLDTFTPLGQLGVLSVDAEAIEDQGTAIVPVQAEPDARAPLVNYAYPPAGAEDVAASARVGVTFDEQVDVRSAFEGSVRLYETESGRRVPGVVSAQEVFVNFHPFCALEPDTDYTLELPARGVTDFAGNALAEGYTTTFRTAP